MKTQLLSLLLFSLTAAAAPGDKDLGKFGSWTVTEVANHVLWNRPACVAGTPGEKNLAQLEVYAEKDGSGEFDDATVQIVTDAKVPAYVRGILVGGKVQAHLMLASTGANPPINGLIARIDERGKIADLLRSKLTSMQVQFISQKNVVVKTLKFSLKGSTKAVDAALAACKSEIK